MVMLRSWRGLSLMAVLLVAVLAASAATQAPAGGVSLRETKEQVVLYTIYRGPYEGVGAKIGSLFQLAMPKGIMPAGPISFVYLNNPELVSKEHYLTEIRIPVGEDALKLAGTLGEFTDVKRLAAMQVAVISKPKGETDVGALRRTLAAWMREHGYEGIDTCCERFLSPMPTGGYADMETEIMWPVKQIPAQKG